MKNERGITLVALIGIMVLLIILAGVSISLVLNDKPEEVPVTNTVTEAPVDVEEDAEPVVEEDEEVTNTVEDDEEPVVDDEEEVEDEDEVENTVVEDEENTNTVEDEDEVVNEVE